MDKSQSKGMGQERKENRAETWKLENVHIFEAGRRNRVIKGHEKGQQLAKQNNGGTFASRKQTEEVVNFVKC